MLGWPRLRELACKPLQSPFLRLTRSTAFFDILESSVWALVFALFLRLDAPGGWSVALSLSLSQVQLALKRFQRETKGPMPKDLCANKRLGLHAACPLGRIIFSTPPRPRIFCLKSLPEAQLQLRLKGGPTDSPLSQHMEEL